MKKLFISLFVLPVCVFAYAQSSDLYDVNYDKPKNIASYNETARVFQDIFLQYEEAVYNREKNVRAQENNINQSNIQKYEEEISLLKKQHEEQLTSEKQKLENALEKEKDANQSNIQKYEEEISLLKKQHEEQLASEKQRAKEELENALKKEKNTNQSNIQKYEEGISLLKKQHEEQLAQEKQRAKEELENALEKQRGDIYEKEIAQLRENEYEKLTAELRDEIFSELSEKFFDDYENKVKEISEKFDSEYKEKIAEFETQNNSKMEIWRKENKGNALKETNARTERFRIVGPIILAIAVRIISIIVICLLLKNIMTILNKRKETNIKKASYVAEYENRLKRLGSSNIFRDEIKTIYEEIDKSDESGEEKNLRRVALKLAENRYEASRDNLSLDEYRERFDSLKTKRHFGTWNMSSDEIETKKALISEFENDVSEYEKNAISACNSKNNQTEITKMLKEYVPFLNSFSDQLNGLKKSEEDETLKEQLSDLSRKYKDLAKNFKKNGWRF